jgi:hypothetical protein
MRRTPFLINPEPEKKGVATLFYNRFLDKWRYPFQNAGSPSTIPRKHQNTGPFYHFF